ncbi:MAG TPA: polymer-forming cytoskeletal protein [Burkholderiales bacterium]|nr:polymer-forming cytoskeletal protein [Burkholderiales bacterium]
MRQFIRKLVRRRRRTLDRTRFSAVLGAETFFRGTLRGKDNYLVYGQVEADANLDGLFVLAAGACWRGNITATHVVIAGEVHGNVSARAKLEIAPSARITGHLRSPVIAMAEGAVHEGTVRMVRRTRMIRFADRRTEKND